MSRKKLPVVFVGSSKEGLRAAQALSNNLRYAAFVKPWPYNFGLNKTVIEDLVTQAPTFDFAVFILSADDLRESRGAKALVPRDNVIFETGLFMGVLGRDRVFLVKRRDAKVELPSDLLGLTMPDYVVPPANDVQSWEAAMSFASSRISDEIERLQFHSSSQAAVTSTEGYLKDAAQYFVE